MNFLHNKLTILKETTCFNQHFIIAYLGHAVIK